MARDLGDPTAAVGEPPAFAAALVAGLAAALVGLAAVLAGKGLRLGAGKASPSSATTSTSGLLQHAQTGKGCVFCFSFACFVALL